MNSVWRSNSFASLDDAKSKITDYSEVKVVKTGGTEDPKILNPDGSFHESRKSSDSQNEDSALSVFNEEVGSFSVISGDETFLI